MAPLKFADRPPFRRGFVKYKIKQNGALRSRVYTALYGHLWEAVKMPPYAWNPLLYKLWDLLEDRLSERFRHRLRDRLKYYEI